jgi:hypothetical protein
MVGKYWRSSLGILPAVGGRREEEHVLALGSLANALD